MQVDWLKKKNQGNSWTDYETVFSKNLSRSRCKGLSLRSGKALGVNRTSQYYHPKENTPSDEEAGMRSASSIVSTDDPAWGAKAAEVLVAASLRHQAQTTQDSSYMREMGIGVIYQDEPLAWLNKRR